MMTVPLVITHACMHDCCIRMTALLEYLELNTEYWLHDSFRVFFSVHHARVDY